MIYRFHPEALEEYRESALYYNVVYPALAARFVTSIEEGINQILLFPEAWQPVEEDVRRHLVEHFPFGLYYTIEDNVILIHAVMHLSRKPGYWKSRKNKNLIS